MRKPEDTEIDTRPEFAGEVDMSTRERDIVREARLALKALTSPGGIIPPVLMPVARALKPYEVL